MAGFIYTRVYLIYLGFHHIYFEMIDSHACTHGCQVLIALFLQVAMLYKMKKVHNQFLRHGFQQWVRS